MKHLVKRNKWLYKKLAFARKCGVGKLVINFTFQRIFRINNQFPAMLHFTSTAIGNNVRFQNDLVTLVSFASSPGLYIQSLNGIELGHRLLIAPGVKLISANHSKNVDRTSIMAAPIKIGDDVWIGANVVILPGVEIGRNCIIGAGSVVTKSFKEPGLVIAGNPALVLEKK